MTCNPNPDRSEGGKVIDKSGFPVGPKRIIQRTKLRARAGKYPFG
jgi:hypothetical protein